MNDHINEKAQVLIQALPYIQKYAGKTVVIKYGGNAMVSDHLKEAVMSDIVLLSLVGIHVVLVHGGGPEITQMLEKTGKESKFVNGLRYTDEETVEIVQMVLAGKLNKSLVQLIGAHGGKALGLCGLDAGLMKAEKMVRGQDLGFVGEITEVNPEPIIDIIDKGYIPVIASVACSGRDTVYNVNADTAAAHIAAELGAENLILMTDIRGLLTDKNDENTLIPLVNASEVPALKSKGIISGGMIPKIDCCVEAVRRGVHRAHIIDGRIEHSILVEMLSNEGVGTMIY